MTAVCLVLLLLLGVSTADDICATCHCGDDNVVDCTNLNLEHHFNNTDWNATEQTRGVKVALFDHNDLVHVLPFPKLPLVKLSLSHNRISRIEDMTFRDLQDLEELDLSHNHMTSDLLGPHIFKGRFVNDLYEPLRSLKILRLNSNALHTLHPDIFEHLPMLEVLTLSSNPFNVLDRPAVMAIVTPLLLKDLDMSYMGLQGDIPDRMLHTPAHLERLDLSGNKFTRVPRGLGDATQLKSLKFNNNPIHVLSSHRSIPEMPELTTLSLSWMPNLTSIEAGALGSMPKLTEFYCSHNIQLERIDPAAFARVDSDGEATLWPPVRKFLVNNNQLEHLENDLLIEWEKMDEINLQGNPWVCDCDNQWMVAKLAKIIEAKHPENMQHFVCEEPVEMRGLTIASLEARDYHMRCLDTHGNHPEKDASVLVWVLVGMLIGVPLSAVALLLWRRYGRRQCCVGGGPADYSRTFYMPADHNGEL